MLIKTIQLDLESHDHVPMKWKRRLGSFIQSYKPTNNRTCFCSCRHLNYHVRLTTNLHWNWENFSLLTSFIMDFWPGNFQFSTKQKTIIIQYSAGNKHGTLCSVQVQSRKALLHILVANKHTETTKIILRLGGRNHQCMFLPITQTYYNPKQSVIIQGRNT